MVLDREFFERSVLKVAPDLLGKFLVRRWQGREIRGVITEVEAYDGVDDKACHGSRGLTPRTRVMFGPAGYFYVYLIYGMYWMLNVVTDKEGYPAAVLIRGVREFTSCKDVNLVDGPGKLTRKFKIGRGFNGRLVAPDSGLWFEDGGLEIVRSEIKKAPRIGVDYAGPVWRDREYRFFVEARD